MQRRFDLARLVVFVVARPVAIRGLMDELKEISGGIEAIVFLIAPHRRPVAGLREIHAELIVPARLRQGNLADVFAAFGANQPVGCVIPVVVFRYDDLVVEVHGLPRISGS